MFAFADDCMIDQDTALKIATGFGGGIALTGEICGACTAGVMVLGLKHGRGLNENKLKKEITYKKVQKFLELFKEQNASICCKDNLNGCDLSTKEGHDLFEEKKYDETVCKQCVVSSIEILQKFI